MVDAPRISVNELHKRMEAGEDFTLIDTRLPAQNVADLNRSSYNWQHGYWRITGKEAN